MEILFRFLFLIAAGALIGGITNYIAIKMLFRPLHPVYLGKWRMPFTPGLIPRRRKDIAEKLGLVVVEHLLTKEGMVEKLYEEPFIEELNDFVKKETAHFLESDVTLLQFLQSWNMERADENVEQFLLEKLEEKYWQAIDRLKGKKLIHVLPFGLRESIDERIPEWSEVFCQKAMMYFESEEGMHAIEHFIERLLGNKGALGNMVKMFLGNESIISKVQAEIAKFFQQPETHQWLESMAKKEWSRFQQKTLREFDGSIHYGAWLEWLKTQVSRHAGIGQWFNRPIHELFADQKDFILETIVPKLVAMLRDFAVEKMEIVMEKLHLEEMVQKQVESFPLERVEEIVLAITSREFKMITYLGALLGGIIGAIQGVMFLFL